MESPTAFLMNPGACVPVGKICAAAFTGAPSGADARAVSAEVAEAEVGSFDDENAESGAKEVGAGLLGSIAAAGSVEDEKAESGAKEGGLVGDAPPPVFSGASLASGSVLLWDRVGLLLEDAELVFASGKAAFFSAAGPPVPVGGFAENTSEEAVADPVVGEACGGVADAALRLTRLPGARVAAKPSGLLPCAPPVCNDLRAAAFARFSGA